MGRSARLAAVTAAAVLAALPSDSRGAGRPVLHKHVLIDTAASVPPGMSVLPGKGGPADLPRAIVAGGEVLPAPSLERAPGAIPSPGKNAWSVPDRSTEAEGELKYEEVFNPATAPFKRLAVFDRVGPKPGYELAVADPALVPAAVLSPRDAPDRERFWGSVTVALTPGERADLPSVAAGMRLLSYATEPTVELEFLRDGAENWYVEPRGLSEPVAVRLVYLVDAPSFYFRGEIPAGLRLDDVPVSMRPASALGIGPRARDRVLEAIGVTTAPSASFAETLDALVGYFRGFEPGDSPRAPGSGGDLFLDLTLSRTGVCRHRAFAFVATAHTLGMPARYVANEAHAFVEVYVPAGAAGAGGAWRRIDLGGAASGLSVSGARDHAVHDPGPDPFPRPEAYDRAYSRLAGLAPRDPAARSGFGGVTGLRDGGGAAAGSGTGTGTGTGAGAGAAPDPSHPGLTPTGSEWDPDAPSVDDLIPGIPSSPFDSPDGDPGVSDPGSAGPEPPKDPRLEVRLVLDVTDHAVLRGDLVNVKGALTDAAGAPLSAQVITFFLVGEGHATAVGSARTGDDGVFSASLVVPAATEVGKYDLRARFAGSTVYRPSIAD